LQESGERPPPHAAGGDRRHSRLGQKCDWNQAAAMLVVRRRQNPGILDPAVTQLDQGEHVAMAEVVRWRRRKSARSSARDSEQRIHLFNLFTLSMSGPWLQISQCPYRIEVASTLVWHAPNGEFERHSNIAISSENSTGHQQHIRSRVLSIAPRRVHVRGATATECLHRHGFGGRSWRDNPTSARQWRPPAYRSSSRFLSTKRRL